MRKDQHGCNNARRTMTNPRPGSRRHHSAQWQLRTGSPLDSETHIQNSYEMRRTRACGPVASRLEAIIAACSDPRHVTTQRGVVRYCPSVNKHVQYTYNSISRSAYEARCGIAAGGLAARDSQAALLRAGYLPRARPASFVSSSKNIKSGVAGMEHAAKRANWGLF